MNAHTLMTLAALLAGCAQDTVKAPPAHQATELYTCGMHPQVVQDHPGTCPICSMNLTPMKSAAEPKTPSTSERTIAYWRAPMDPSYIRDQPGKSPMGMDLIPVYDDDLDGVTDNLVEISPGFGQQMGVETAPAERTSSPVLST